MRIFKDETNYKFMNKMYYGFIGSGLIILVGILLFFTHGFNQGIDFTGGTNIEISLRDTTTVNSLRATLRKVGLGNATIQRAGSSETNRFFIKTSQTSEIEENSKESETTTADKPATRATQQTGVAKLVEDALLSAHDKSVNVNKLDLNNTSEQGIIDLLVDKGVPIDTAKESAAKLIELRKTNESLLIDNDGQITALNLKNQVNSVLKENTYLGPFTFLSVEMVGAQVGHDLRNKATLAAFWALLGMLIYIGFRFRLAFGLSGVLTLFHDVLVSLSFILIFQIEMSLSVIAAILTLVGYSINDTIVIFDRIRDNIKLMKRSDANTLIDTSINQTLSRTIMTGGTTLLTVVALFFFGGEIIHGFSFVLMVGIIVGTYSSIYQSCAWLLIWKTNILVQKKK